MAENENDIGGRVSLDTSDFKANINALNRQIQIIDTGFRAAAAGMDDWGSSQEGLEQRINALNGITDLQRQKVANLTAQYQQIVAEQGESSRAAQALQVTINRETEALNRNLRELGNVTQSLDDLRSGSDQAADSTDDLANSAESAGEQLKDMGSAIAEKAALGIAAIGAAALSAVGSLVKFGDESNKAMNHLQTQTGATAEQMEEFRDTANDIYADNFGESVDDIANAMAAVNQVTKQTGDELKKTSENALLMRDVFDFEVADSIKAANALMTNFGISSDEAYALIAQGAQNGANKSGDLLDVLNEFAPHFAQLGLDANEFTDTLIQGASSGAFEIATVGDAVKEFGIITREGTDDARAALTEMGLDATKLFSTFAAGGPESAAAFNDVVKRLGDMKDPIAQNQAGVALFGTMWEDLGVQAIKALGDINDTADMTGDTLQQLNDVQYNDIGSALEGVKRQLITDLSGPINDLVMPAVNDLVDTVKNMDFGPIVDGLGWIINNAGNIAAGAAAIGTAMLTWNVVSMVMGLVEAIKLWRVANEGLTIAQIALNLAMSLNPIGLIITIVAGLVAAIIVLWNTNEDFRNALIGAWDAIKGAFIAVIDWVKGNWGNLLLLLTNPIAGALKMLYDMNPNFKKWVDGIWSTIVDVIKNLPGKIAGFFNEIPGKIGYALGLAIGTMIKWGQEAINWVMTDVPKIISNIVSFFVTLPGKIAAELSSAFSRFIEWSSNLIATAKTEIPKVINTIVTFFTSLPSKMLDIGENIVRGLWDGIKNMTGWIKDKISDFAGGIVDGMKDSLGIHSPSRVMRDEVGKMVGAGMAEGISQSARQVTAAMDQISGEVTGGLSGKSAAPSGGSTKNTYNFEKMLDGATFYVRDDADVTTIVREVVNVISGGVAMAGRGMGAARGATT
ncbi:phage tail tape measure protein [Paenibacillus sp. sgz500958]|uniref:phage tail tape measure protein n=1 Tax=Paenibacillus sp. sgz500958 TaxID=3242475 RepID=UPI0036D34441